MRWSRRRVKSQWGGDDLDLVERDAGVGLRRAGELAARAHEARDPGEERLVAEPDGDRLADHPLHIERDVGRRELDPDLEELREGVADAIAMHDEAGDRARRRVVEREGDIEGHGSPGRGDEGGARPRRRLA
jgi:hypothetical protein